MEPTDHISKYADSIRLSDAERSSIKLRLVAHLRENPSKVASHFSLHTLFISSVMRGGAFAFLVLIVVAGVEMNRVTPTSVDEPIPMMMLEQTTEDAFAPAFTKQANPDTFMMTSDASSATSVIDIDIATSTASTTPPTEIRLP